MSAGELILPWFAGGDPPLGPTGVMKRQDKAVTNQTIFRVAGQSLAIDPDAFTDLVCRREAGSQTRLKRNLIGPQGIGDAVRLDGVVPIAA